MTTKSLIPAIALGVLLGLGAGVGTYTFVYAKGYSYLTNNPEACANCHIMRQYYDGWLKASHHAVATCNDCHTPAGLISKYVAKASNGFWHSFAFTSGNFHEPLRIRPGNREITEQACRNCHQEIVAAIEGGKDAAETSCIRCHASVGHMGRLGGTTAGDQRFGSEK
jgi:cytochrome c nitrite reductase small subunit